MRSRNKRSRSPRLASGARRSILGVASVIRQFEKRLEIAERRLQLLDLASKKIDGRLQAIEPWVLRQIASHARMLAKCRAVVRGGDRGPRGAWSRAILRLERGEFPVGGAR
jgi:hypothetical protein